MSMRTCPLMATSEEESKRLFSDNSCLEQSCAWWDAQNNECCVSAASRAIVRLCLEWSNRTSNKQ